MVSHDGKPATASGHEPDPEGGFRVGDWEVDPPREALRRGSETRHVEHKVMRTLIELARHPGEIVTRNQFLDRVWEGRVVNEEALSRAISLLRAALDDDTHEPRYIQTIPRTGYRLIAAVGPITRIAPASPPAAPAPFRSRPRVVLSFTLLLLICGALILLARGLSGTRNPHYDSIAVLPFTALDDGNNEYFAAGLTEELGTALARVEGLRVVSTSWTRGVDPVELRRRAGVDAVTEGTVRQRGETLRITARVIDARSGEQLWADAWERDERDIFAVQSEITAAIVASLHGTLGAAPRIEPASADLGAYRSFLLGRHLIERRGAANIRKGIGLLEQAVALDPGFVAAHVMLAEGHALLPSYEDADEETMLARAEIVLDHASALSGPADPTRALRGFIALRRGQWIEAEQEFRRALDAAPDSVEALQWHSVLLAAVGYTERARGEAEHAVSLDPLSPIVNYRLASLCAWQGDSECGERQAALAIELGLDPFASPEPRLLLLVRQRRFEELERALRAMQTGDGAAVDWIGPWVDALQAPEEAKTAAALARLTDAYRAKALSARFLFGAAMTLGDGQAALAAARELVTSHHFPDGIESVYSPEGAVVRRQPGFIDLARDTGLVAFWERHGWPELCEPRARPPVCN